MALTQFSGFSGKPIDILASQDLKNKELTVDQRPFFKLYLVCSPDFGSCFHFALSMTPPEGQTSRHRPISKGQSAMSGSGYDRLTRLRVSARISDLGHLSFLSSFS
jgi:hypothetical protein